MRGVRKNRYREATRTLQSGVPDNLRGCWSGLYPYASRSKYQSSMGLPSCSIHVAIRRREFMSGSLKTALEPLVVVTRSFPSRTMPSADLHTSPLA